MKNVLICLALIGCFGCHKSPKNPQDYPHLTSQQIWDSIGFIYEKKYFAFVDNHYNLYRDTIVFHSNHTITEICPSSHEYPPHFLQIDFPFSYIGVDSLIEWNTHSGKYSRQLFLVFNTINDTITNACILHDYLVNDKGYMTTPADTVHNFSFHDYNYQINFILPASH